MLLKISIHFYVKFSIFVIPIFKNLLSVVYMFLVKNHGPYVQVKTFLWTLHYSIFDLLYVNYRTNNSKKPREDYSKAVRKVLKEWLHKHLINPYPSDGEKLYLANKTGLTVLQVNKWFINARRREFKSLIDKSKHASELKHELVDEQFVNAGNGNGANDDINYRKKNSKKPLKEWLHKHLTDPYPSDAEKLHLANKTGLTVLQVHSWFKDARRREFKSLIDKSKQASEPKNELVDEQFKSEELHNIPNKSKKTKRKRVVKASFSNTKVSDLAPSLEI